MIAYRLTLVSALAVASLVAASCGEVANVATGLGGAEYKPVTLEPMTLLPATVGVAYKEVPKSTGGAAPMAWQISEGGLPEGLKLDPASGVIEGTVGGSAAGQEAAFTLTVRDGNDSTATRAYVLKVQAYAFEISPQELPPIIPRQAYAIKLGAVGATPPVVYAFDELPKGLTFDEKLGVLTATDEIASLDTDKNPTSIVVTGTDKNNVTATRKFKVTVAPASYQPLKLGERDLRQVPADVPYKEVLTVKGGVGPFSFKVLEGELPPGLVLDADNGILSGTVTAMSVKSPQGSFTVKVTDSFASSDQRTYAYSIVPYAVTVVPEEVPMVLPTVPFSMQFAALGANGTVTYKLAGGLPSNLRLTTAGVLETHSGTVRPADANTQWPVEVTAKDINGVIGTTALTIRVGATPANSSPLSIQTAALAPMISSSSYNSGISTTGGVAPLVFSITSGVLPTGLTLNSTTGVISGSIPNNPPISTYAVVIRVVDGIGDRAERTYSGSVTAGSNPLNITTTSLVAPSAGVPYAAVVSVTGGVAPYTFAIDSGSLPPGLTLSGTSGVLSGTPTFATSGVGYGFDIKVTDVLNQITTRSYAVNVAAVSPLTVATTSVPAMTANSTYSATIVATGGVPPYTFDVSTGTLPSGLTLSAGGVISGTPTAASRNQPFGFTVRATDSRSPPHTATQSLSGTIGDYATSLLPTSLVPPLPGSYYAGTVVAVGGVAPITYALTSGTLPTGMALNASTGVLSGIVADSEAGNTRNVTITATDANGATAQRSYAISTVSFAIDVTTASLADAIEGAAYTNGATSLAATGGTAPYTYTYVGTLPAGVGMTSTGTFFGVPAAGQGSLGGGTTYPITVRARDATGAIGAAETLSLVVRVGTPTMTAGNLDAGSVGMPYSRATTASSGRPPYTYTVSGSLPAGLTMSPLGVISGTPTASTTCPAAQFAIIATDALSQTSSGSVFQCIAVSNGVSLTTSSLTNAIEGFAYSNGSTALAATGGTAPYSYTYTGTLPAGVGLTNGGAFFGTPASGQGSIAGVDYPLTIQVRDALNRVSLPTALTLRVVVNSPSVVGTPTSGVVGAPYSFSFGATGGRPAYTYAVSGSLPAGLSMSAAGVVTGTPTATAACPAAQFAVIATDALSQTSSGAVFQCIAVTNGVSLATSSLANATEGVAYSNASTALSATGGTAPYTYTYTGSLPAGVGLTNGGVFFGTPTAGQGSIAGIDYPLSIQVRDAINRLSLPTAITLRVVVNTPTVGAGTPANAVLGTPYTFTFNASGGRPPYSFAVSGGSLPAGLTLNADGSVTGTPTGTSVCPGNQFSITATDALTQTSASANKCITTVNGISITNTAFPPVIIGTNYNHTVTVVGGTTPYAFSASSLPSGITIHPTTGVLSGFTNAASGDYTGYIVVTDSTSGTALTTTRSVTFRVRSPLTLPATTIPRAPAAPGAGMAYQTTSIAATGGVTPVTHTLTSGQLPNGITLSSAGVLSGTATFKAAVGGAYSFTVTATDAAGQTTSRSYSMAVSVAPRITTTSLPPAVVGVDYAADLERIGGANQFTAVGNSTSQLLWDTDDATPLPSGLTLHATSGRISGQTSASPGSYPITFELQDAHGFKATKSLTLVIRAAGRTLDLKTPRFSEPCTTANVNCDPRAHAVGRLNASATSANTQQFVVYSRNDTTPRSLQIARIDQHGRISRAGVAPFSVNLALNASHGTITGLELDDIDLDGRLDIVFVDTTQEAICVLWNGGTVDTVGMPTGFSSTGTGIDCWPVPNGGNAGNFPNAITISNELRPDSTNYGKKDIVVTTTQAANNPATVSVLLNTCSLNASTAPNTTCTSSATRGGIFAGYVALTGDVTNGSAVIANPSTTTNVQVGMPIIGNGIPAGTTVASFTGGITMSANATATATGVRLKTAAAFTTTGTTTNASAILTAVASTANATVGRPIFGAGIPAGATIRSFTVNTITMSVAATATAAGITVTLGGPNSHTPLLIGPTSHMRDIWNARVGYFDAPRPNLPGTLATSTAQCPGIVVAGFQNTATGNGYAYVMRQSYASSTCQGDFATHNTGDEVLVANGTPWLSGIAVADFNKDGWSDVSITTGTAQTTSSSVRTYLTAGTIGSSPEGAFDGATNIASQLQTLNGINVGGGRIRPYCLDGSSSCDYPGLMVVCNRETINSGTAGSTGCLAILPNACTTSGCLTPFEPSTPQKRIDYAAPPILNRDPITAPVVASVAFTANTTSGSNTLTSVSSTVGVTVGKLVTGVGIPDNVYVASVSGATVTLTGNATATNLDVAMQVPATARFTGDTANGSAAVTNVSPTTGITIGQPITGTGIPANTYVADISGATLTLSATATATATGVSMQVPLVPTRNDVIIMGTDATFNGTTGSAPFFLVYARNGTSTTDPLRSGMHLPAFPSNFMTAAEIGPMKMGDMNGDGSPDLLAYLVNQGGVSTFLSGPSLGVSRSLGTTLAPSYLADYTYLGCPSGSTSCFPDPTFNTVGVVHGYSAPTNPNFHAQNTMDVMDINNDGISDVVTTGFTSRGVAVALGMSTGGLESPSLYDVGTAADVRPQAVAFADLDQDGFPDIVAASITYTGTITGYLSWLKGNGDGSFEQAQQIPTTYPACADPRAVATPDLDGDGRPELAVLCYTNQALWIGRRHSNAAGTWVWQSSATLNSGLTTPGTFMKFGRLTSTSGLDLVVGGQDVANGYRVITGVTVTVTNHSTGAITPNGTATGVQSIGGWPSDVDIADIDQDGTGDMIFGMQSQNSSASAATPNGQIFYTCQASGSSTCRGWGMEGYQMTSVLARDLNGDSQVDVLVGYRAGSVAVQRLIYRTISRSLNNSW